MNQISTYRKQLGLTQMELARLCGWNTQSRIAQYEAGKRTPNIDDCKSVRAAFEKAGVQVSIDELFPA
jgi:putative transcriptional regulator